MPAKSSFESERLRAFYGVQEARLVRQGKLRQDYAPSDAPVNADVLVRNFRKIALFNEYRTDTDELVQETTTSHLRRWAKPIKAGIYFGPSVPRAQRQSMTKEVRSFAGRLSSVTGVPFSFTSLEAANFLILVLNRDEQISEPRKLARRARKLDPRTVINIETLPDEFYCAAFSEVNNLPPRDYSGAVVVIKAEVGPIKQVGCIQEEMSQAMGLINDDNSVRPSIFNDDDEFATLTRHDELLLKMLYDPRLHHEITPATQSPVLRQVASDVMAQTRF